MTATPAAAVSQPTEQAWTLGPIVDADAHIDPPYEMWKEYLPTHLSHLAPVIEEGEEYDWIVFEGNRRAVGNLSNLAGKDHKDYKLKMKRSEMRPVWLPETRLADMDADGVDVAMLFGGGPLGTFNNELYIASYEAYNRWVMDFCKADSRRLVPIGYVPMRDLDETIGLIKRLAEMGFRTINIPAYPQNPDGWSTSSTQNTSKAGQFAALTGDPNAELQYTHPVFDQLWALLCDLDMGITMHLGGRVPRFGDKSNFLHDLPMSKVAMAEPIGMFIYSGIFQRFPKLRLAIVESGVGWLSWYAEYCDRTWEKQRYWTENKLENPPSFYLDQNIYASFLQDRVGILNRNMSGGKNIMWSSDYPHSETTFPRSREIILRDFKGVPEEDTRDIICNNARKFFRLD